jgi:hypothetical protein
MFCNKASFYGEELSTPRPTPSWKTTHCRLPTTAYSIYLQLPSILKAVPPSTTCEDAPYLGDRDPLIMDITNVVTWFWKDGSPRIWFYYAKNQWENDMYIFMLYLLILLLLHNSEWWGDWWMMNCKGFEGSFHGIIEVLLQYVFFRNLGKPWKSVQVAYWPQFEPSPWWIQAWSITWCRSPDLVTMR